MQTRRTIHWRIFIPLVVVVVLTHAIVTLVRLSLVYLGIRQGYDPTTVAIISASYSLVPIFVTVIVGQLNDSGYVALSAVIGAVLLLISVATVGLAPTTLVIMVLGNVVLGLGQTFLINSTQMMLPRASDAGARDATIGYYMIAASIGQFVAPSLVAASGAGGTVDVYGPLLIGIGLASALVLVACVMWKVERIRTVAARTPPLPVSALYGNRPLLWIVVGSAVAIGASDLVIIFVPLLGDQRGIDPAVVSALLAARAASAIPCRLMFGWLTSRLGRPRLLLWSLLLAGVSLTTLLFELPTLVFGVAVILSGVGLGLAMPTSLSITYDVSPPGLLGTATSLRTTAARITQFTAPFGAGLLASSLGASGVFPVVGVILCAVAIQVNGVLSQANSSRF